MKEKKFKYINHIEILFASVIIFVGIFLRWKAWQADLSFWVDEDALIFMSTISIFWLMILSEKIVI